MARIISKGKAEALWLLNKEKFPGIVDDRHMSSVRVNAEHVIGNTSVNAGNELILVPLLVL